MLAPRMTIDLPSSNSSLVFFQNGFPSLQRRLIVISAFVRALGQLDLGPLHFLVWNQSQDMRDAIESRAPLVVRMNNVPGRMFAVSFLEHLVAGARVSVPAPVRFEIHGT
jgi:hypothetical protein